MAANTRTIDQLIKLSSRVAETWLKKPTNAGSAITGKAILAVCNHLSREAGHRSDIAELIRRCQSAINEHGGETQATASLLSNETAREVLTLRQIEILQLFARGLSYEEVGAQLKVSTRTVKNHASAIYDRLSVKNKTEAVYEARALGLDI